MCACVCVFIELHITAQFDPVILVNRIDPPRGGSGMILNYENLLSDATKGHACVFIRLHPCGLVGSLHTCQCGSREFNSCKSRIFIPAFVAERKA